MRIINLGKCGFCNVCIGMLINFRIVVINILFWWAVENGSYFGFVVGDSLS